MLTEDGRKRRRAYFEISLKNTLLYGGADWVETQKAIPQDMMLKEFGWERFYKGSNPRENLLLSDYRREKVAEMVKEEERKLEDIKDKVVTGQATIQVQAEQLEVMLESLDKGAETERQMRN